MALAELRAKLPHGDVGRIINSYVFPWHPDALEQAVAYREQLRKQKPRIHRIFMEVGVMTAVIRDLSNCDACRICDYEGTVIPWIVKKIKHEYTIDAVCEATVDAVLTQDLSEVRVCLLP